MPTHDEIFAKVRSTLVDALGVDEEDVTPESSLRNDLGAESIDLLDIVFRLERNFGIKIPRGELFPENVSDPNLEVWVHLVRAADQVPTPLPPCDTWFGRRFDAAYRECLREGLFRNDLFVTWLLRPQLDVRRMLARLIGRAPSAPRGLPVAETVRA